MRNVVAYFRSWFGRFEAVSYRRPDPWLCLPAAALMALGLLMVLNTTYFIGQEKTGDAFHYFKLHLVHIAAGFVVLLAISQFSLTGLRRLVMPLMIVAVVLLILTRMPGLGVVRGGARRWVRLGPVLAEPSELVKFAVVFFLADFLAKRQEVMASFKHGPLSAFLIVGPIAVIVLAQPDFGTTVMLVLILFAMLFAAGARGKHLGAAGGLAVGALAILAVAKPYRMRRLTS
ncbi:MAG: FtsW/RodA/SpoVE family cell cycle protein, partial [Deltaproteobacteria bacterium]|nr:FtsW/RodA/SpoVE family cell cycle protein [Deltaproteobacteria bacterium]